MSNNPIIAYIPARGGSKRIPNKNRKLLNGKPIILYAIELLKSLPWIQEVCVSTDDQEITQISEEAGAITLGFRDKELSNDYCPFIDLLKKDIIRFENHLKLNRGNYKILMVLPTAALLTEAILNDAMESFFKSKSKFLFSSVKYEISAFWAFCEIDRKKLKPLFPDKLLERSQDLEITLTDAGLFYFLDSEFVQFAKKSWFIHSDISHFLVGNNIAIDVDEESDWERLENSFL